MEINKDIIEATIKSGLISVAASVPGAASIAQAWNEYENHVQLKRIEESFDFLKDRLGENEDRIKKNEEYILKSGEVPSLIEKTFQKIRAELSYKKRKSFIHLLAESIAIGYGLSYESKYTFIEILDTLTEQDLNLFLKFEKVKTLRGKDLIDVVSSDNSDHASKIITSLSKLESRGLIAETDYMDYSRDTAIGGCGTEDNWLNRWRKKYLTLLPDGSTFLSMVHEGEKTKGSGTNSL